MSQNVSKIGNHEVKKEKQIGAVIEQSYDKYFANTGDWNSADFYHAVCQTVEEINKKIGSTQFRVPKTSTLEHAYKKHHQGKGKSLTKEEFQKILEEVIVDTGVTNIGAKEVFFYIFGVPATALFLKQRFIPKLIPSEVFIPVVTSVTVFLLAKFNKI